MRLARWCEETARFFHLVIRKCRPVSTPDALRAYCTLDWRQAEVNTSHTLNAQEGTPDSRQQSIGLRTTHPNWDGDSNTC